MEIRINKLRLRNFKGVRSAEYVFGGRNARLEGPNGSGKSTVFDAFTWLLFGKDHRDQTATSFEIKTIDPSTGKPFPREDHWVEAELTVDGADHTLRRTWIEKWEKPTGEVEDVMTGHASAFAVDGVDVVTKQAYDTVVAGWMKEAVFKLLTNPLYFIDDAFTPWKDRRKALLNLVKDAPERERVREEYADVIERLAGRSVEDYRKLLALEKAANKRDLAQTLSRIDGMREALPEETDGNAVRVRIDSMRSKMEAAVGALKAKAEEIDRAITSADKADEARKAKNAAIWSEITGAQLAMERILAEAKKGALAQNNARDEDRIRVRANIKAAEAVSKGERAQMDRTLAELGQMEKERGRMAGTLAELGDRYRAEKAKAFEYTPDTRCPYCGQEIPAETVEKARAEAQKHFVAERKAVIDKILTDARALKEDIGKMDARMAGMKDIVSQSEAKCKEAQADVAKWTAELGRLDAQPAEDLGAIEAQARAGDEYRALQREEMALRAKALQTANRPDDVDELVRQRKAIEDQIADERAGFARAELEAQGALSVGKVRAEQLALIAQKEREAKNFADALAKCERDEARAAEYVQADINSVEDAINGMFRASRWKMFDRTIDGRVVETCEVTSPDGVPYRSMNDAQKVICGMDFIRVFSEHCGGQAPIFIDNAEGILRDSFDTPAQVIRLVVKDTPKLTLVTE